VGLAASSDLAARTGVVVITRNRSAELQRALARLADVEPGLAVVVIDNASTDGTAALVRTSFPGVRLREMKTNLGGAGRNVGVEELALPYIAFADDDTWWERDSLLRAVEVLDANADVAVVCGGFVIEPDARKDPARVAFAQSPLRARARFPGTRVLGFLAGASVVRRDAFLQVGGFHPRFLVGGEEALVAYDLADAGWSLAYVDEIVVHHEPSTTRDVERRRAIELRNALWTAWLRRPLPDAWSFTRHRLRPCWSDPAKRRGLIEAIRGIPWILHQRSVVGAGVAADLRLLDRQTAEISCG
jgi:GT2 family glycosyltransferase